MALYNAANNAESRLAAEVFASNPEITVEDASVFPDPPFMVTVEEEIMEVTAVNVNVLSVKRGQEGTVAVGHVAGTKVENLLTAGMWNGLQNTVEQIKQSGFRVGNVTGLAVEIEAGLKIELFWKDPVNVTTVGDNGETIMIAKWKGTQLRRKEGSYPVDEHDGELLVDSIVRDQYVTAPYVDEGLVDGKEYFYMLFPYTDNGVFTVDSANRVKGTAIYKFPQTPPADLTVTAITRDSATIKAEGAVVSIDQVNWFASPHSFTGLTIETAYTAYAKFEETTTHYESAVVEKVFSTLPEADDLTGSPGPLKLLAGNMQAGFFGIVPASELITGDALASAVGLSAGTSQNSATSWLKFAIDGKIIFSPMKPVRHSLAWGDLDAAKVVSGEKTTLVQGKQFKVRLWKGANVNPATAPTGTVNHKSEWNKLMLPIHEESIDKTWSYPANVESDISTWPHNLGAGRQGMFSDQDLLTHYSLGNGARSWCQEITSSNRLVRGGGGPSWSSVFAWNEKSAYFGWRPVLEVV